jgi:CRP-like cAMP-binding protein
MPLGLQIGERSPNQLLSSLSVEEYARIIPQLHTLKFSLGDVIGDHADQHFAYFPTTCVVSLICDMEDGSTAEVALAGNEGLLGTSLFLGGGAATNRAVVGIAGEAVRMSARVLRDHFMRAGAFQRALLRYTDTLITQISLTAACNRKHTLEKRLCRWLLLLRDRTGSDEMMMTQEFIANMLGGRRETVTVAAGHLQDAGLIHYTRGRLRIVDRKRLEEFVCECYKAVSRECNRWFAGDADKYVSVYSKSNAEFAQVKRAAD